MFFILQTKLQIRKTSVSEKNDHVGVGIKGKKDTTNTIMCGV